MGVIGTLGNVAPENLRVFVMDNQGYERVRHDISATRGKTDLAAIAQACGIPGARTVRTEVDFAEAARSAMEGSQLSFVVAKVESGIADVAPRPGDGIEDKFRFVRYVERLEGKAILASYRAKLD